MDNFDFGILRELRKHASMSIAELSAASGVSTAVISKLERNQTRAELDTLLRLARVFELSTADLLSMAEAHSSRREKATAHQSEDFLFQEVRYRNIRCLMGQAPAGARVSRPKIHRDDFEICWVMEGAVKIDLPSESFVLRDGNSVQFDALLEHTYEALEASKILIIHQKKNRSF